MPISTFLPIPPATSLKNQLGKESSDQKSWRQTNNSDLFSPPFESNQLQTLRTSTSSHSGPFRSMLSLKKSYFTTFSQLRFLKNTRLISVIVTKIKISFCYQTSKKILCCTPNILQLSVLLSHLYVHTPLGAS